MQLQQTADEYERKDDEGDKVERRERIKNESI